MQDDEALDALSKLEDWKWQKPEAVSEIAFDRIVKGCLSFLNDAPGELSAQTGSDLEGLAERSHQRLFQFLPAFRRRFEQAESARQHGLLEEALEWSGNRFERMVIRNYVRGWQCVSDAGLTDEMLSVDDLVLRAARDRWQKVAMIVGMIMMAQRGLVDTAIAERVRSLVQRGMLEAQGDLSDLRSSEVRLPTGELGFPDEH